MVESSTATARPSCGTVEQVIREIWGEYFGRVVSPYDDFFELGGDSLAMIEVVRRARDRGLPVRASAALRNPSPARLAEAITVHAADAAPVTVAALAAPPVDAATAAGLAPEPIVDGPGTPLHVVHSDSHVQAEREAVSTWATAVTGIPLPGTRGPVPPFTTVAELAEMVLAALPEQAGPYRLAGFGPGAVVAFDVARALAARGATVAELVLVRPPAPGPAPDPFGQRLAALARRFGLSGSEDVEEIHARLRRDGWYDDTVRPADLPRLQRLSADLTLATTNHRPARYDGPAVLVHDLADPPELLRTWSAVPGLQTHAFDHGIDSPLAILRDERLAQVVGAAVAGRALAS